MTFFFNILAKDGIEMLMEIAKTYTLKITTIEISHMKHLIFVDSTLLLSNIIFTEGTHFSVSAIFKVVDMHLLTKKPFKSRMKSF